MRPLGPMLSAWFEFLRAALISLAALGVMFVGSLAARLAAVAGKALILLRRLIHLRPSSLLLGLLQLAVLIYLALPETRCYFEQKESRAPSPA